MLQKQGHPKGGKRQMQNASKPKQRVAQQKKKTMSTQKIIVCAQ
jgi:hypothetical protein